MDQKRNFAPDQKEEKAMASTECSTIWIFSQRFKALRREIKKLIRSEYHKCHQHFSVVLKKNPKRFWSYHSIKSKSKRLPDISTYNGITATKPQEQVNLYNIDFYSVFYKESSGAPSILLHDI